MLSRRPARASGFTLIELLVVIAIIALLVSILLPSLNRAKELTKSVVCQANLRSIGIAMGMYTTETSHYPGGHTYNPPDAACMTWPSRLRTYAASDIFWCVSADPTSKWTVKFGRGLAAQYGYQAGEVRLGAAVPFSYGYNNWGSWDTPWGGAPQYGLGGYSAAPGQATSHDYYELPASRVNVPADMIAIGDSSVNGYWDAFIDPECEKDPATEWPEYPSARHMGKTNLVFCDGHVESIIRDDIVGASDRAIRRWNNDNTYHIRP